MYKGAGYIAGALLLLSFVLFSCSNRQISKLAKAYKNFSYIETEHIMAQDSSVAMRVWIIDNLEDSLLLRKQCSDVDFNKEDIVLETFIHRLYKTVIDSVNQGVGIAAPQVGILKNIIWVQRFDKIGYPFEVYLNPKITHYSSEKQPCREGCLSIPNRMDTLQVRSQAIEIDYLNNLGETKHESVEGFTAVIFQHEIDHLNGILYTDYLK